MITGKLTCKHSVEHLSSAQKVRLFAWFKLHDFGLISFDTLWSKVLKYKVVDVGTLWSE